MTITRIPTNPSRAEHAEIVSMLPPGGVCRACGRWRCAVCSAEGSIRNRFYPDPHGCSSCKTLDGEMPPSRHPDAVDHLSGFIAMSVDDECSFRHHVETPILHTAEHLIARVREVLGTDSQQ